MIIEYKELVRVSKFKAASDSANDIPLPGMLEPKTDLEDWQSKLINALSAQKGVDTTPLSYVIRPTTRVALHAVATA